jgi:hypothetical protein
MGIFEAERKKSRQNFDARPTALNPVAPQCFREDIFAQSGAVSLDFAARMRRLGGIEPPRGGILLRG